MSRPRMGIAALWGGLGFVAFLVHAVVKLFPVAIEPIYTGMSALEWSAYGGWIVFMAYSEGYRGFHIQASPRVVARSLTLSEHRHPLRLILAPAFCMGLFHAAKKRLIISWSVLCVIIALIVVVRSLRQPWRGIVDGGVVVGLLLGALSTLYYMARAFAGAPPRVDPELPTRKLRARPRDVCHPP